MFNIALSPSIISMLEPSRIKPAYDDISVLLKISSILTFAKFISFNFKLRINFSAKHTCYISSAFKAKRCECVCKFYTFKKHV